MKPEPESNQNQNLKVCTHFQGGALASINLSDAALILMWFWGH